MVNNSPPIFWGVIDSLSEWREVVKATGAELLSWLIKI